jgi:hypothetical protein
MDADELVHFGMVAGFEEGQGEFDGGGVLRERRIGIVESVWRQNVEIEGLRIERRFHVSFGVLEFGVSDERQDANHDEEGDGVD